MKRQCHWCGGWFTDPRSHSCGNTDEGPPRHCDSCERDLATTFSPAHDAHFCVGCYEREVTASTRKQQP